MAVDPSIILGVRPPQFDNPVDLQAKGMQMQNMGIQNQMQQRAMADDQATRQAYSQAMTAGPNGPTLDKQKLLSSLPPMLAYKAQQELTANDAAQAKSQIEVSKAQKEMHAQELGSLLPLPPDQKQAAYSALKQKNIAAGIPGAANAPDQYPGDQYIYQAMTALMGPKDQMELKEKQSEFASREADRQLQRQTLGMGKQNQALQQTQSILESARGNPAVAQAQKDIYAANKFGSLVNLHGDPNNLNPQELQLAASEVSKIATGGVPTSHELQGLTPSTIPTGLASLAQKVMNNPVGADAGEFVKRMQDYTNALKKDAQDVVKEKYGRVIETRRGQLGEQHYNDLKAQYLDPLMTDIAKSAAHPQDNQALQWAKSNPNDPRSAAIIKLNSGGQ